jgi:hypothetical protein
MSSTSSALQQSLAESQPKKARKSQSQKGSKKIESAEKVKPRSKKAAATPSSSESSAPSSPKTSQHGLPLPILKTKLGVCGPAKVKKPFIKHDSKILPVHFLGNLLRQDTDNDKLAFEIDDDTFDYLTKVGNNFSMDVDFKLPNNKSKGKFYINGALDDEWKSLTNLEVLMRNTVEVHGILKTYNFFDDAAVQKKGCSLKITEINFPGAAVDGGDDSGAEMEDESSE